ncbi:prepilin-type N-terminal cleavage/methylation domain-containing protein [Candidatus Omnitrophota bacterium]
MRHAQGFTLLEILIALVVVATSVIVIMGLFADALVGSVDAENITIAMNLAQRRTEEIRNLDYDTGVVDEPKDAVSGFAGFQRDVVVSESETDLKQVTTTVYYTYQGAVISVPLVTYISRN